MENDRTADTVASRGAQRVSPDGAVLLVLTGDSKGASVRTPARPGTVLRVGKSSDNDLVLSDKTVSRHHVEVERTDRGLVVRDLGSRNGTCVGGVRIQEAMVEPGTLLAVGDVQLLVRVDLEDT